MARTQKQWITLSAVLFIALLARMSVADPVIQKRKTKKVTRSTASSEMVVQNSQSSFPIDLSVGPDMMFIPGGAGFGVSVHAVTPVTHTMPLYVGVESGVDFGAGGVSGALGGLGGLGGSSIGGGSATVIHMLATGVYRFNLPNARSIHPYAGVSVGPSLAFYSDPTFGGVVVASSTKPSVIQFEALLRAGVSFDLSSTIALNVEPKVGIFGGDFMFRPVVAAAFSL